MVATMTRSSKTPARMSEVCQLVARCTYTHTYRANAAPALNAAPPNMPSASVTSLRRNQTTTAEKPTVANTDPPMPLATRKKASSV